MTRLQRRLSLLAVALCAASAPLPAQQKFTSTTSLLTLDVSVLDRDGNPVTGLTPEDFVVTLNKETQPVRTMVFLATQNHNTTQTVRASSLGQPAPAAASNTANSEPDPKLLVIMIDDESIHPTESKGLFVAAERFIDSIPARDWVGLTTTSGHTTVNPSLDRGPLVRNLGHAFGSMNDPRRDSKPYVGFFDALDAQASASSLQTLIGTACGLAPAVYLSKNIGQLIAENDCAHEIDRKVRDNARFAEINTRNRLDTYTKVIKAMASAPGVKQLVILTGGIAIKGADSLDFVPVAKAAAESGVQISMMMEEPEYDFMVKDQRQMLQAAETLAEMSGGQFFRVVGQADRFYQRVLTSASAIYRIGVDLPKAVPTDGNYKVAVTVKRPGVKVLAARFAPPPAPKVVLPPDEQMKRAIATGEPLFALPVQLAAEVVAARDGGATMIRVSVDVSGEAQSPISGMLGVLGPDRQLKTSRHELSRSGDDKTYILDVLVPAAAAGVYELRFAAADTSGAVGAVTRTIDVKAPGAGPH